MVKKNDGVVVFVVMLGYFLVIVVLLLMKLVFLLGMKVLEINLVFEKMNNGNVFVGIVIGLIVVYVYNKFSEIELLLVLLFFSGKCLVLIMIVFYCIFLVVILLFLWLLFYLWIVKFGEFIVGLGLFGVFIYGVVNRLLIFIGLYYVLNSVFWFDMIGINDIGKF